ncbi:MAG: methyltransferase [Labedaea sp.]
MGIDLLDADTLVPAIVAAARDRSALSDELHFAARGPAERYHLDRGRANPLRALDILPDAAVLQLGAEYGALTRHLGETARLVDAVEPDPDRAAVVTLRTAGLAGVRVVGGLAGLPDGVGYDLAVIAEPGVRPALLRAVLGRLRPEGVLVICAADLVGRREAESALRSAGLPVARVLTCTPGHPVARAVVSEDLAREQPRLAVALAPAEEPGFLVLGGPRADLLWPAERLARYFNTTDRSAAWCTSADVVRTATGAEVRRTPLRPDPEPVAGIRVRPCVDVVRDAPTMLTVLLEEPWRVAELLSGWRDLLRAQAPQVGPALWDLLPHNVLVDGAALHPIDLEWEHATAGVAEVTERGLLVLAHYLTVHGWVGAADDSPMRELAGWLGVLLGLDPSFVDAAAAREVDFGTIGSCGTDRGAEEVRGAIRMVWEQRLEQKAGEYRSPS